MDYKDLVEGDGEVVKRGDLVEVDAVGVILAKGETCDANSAGKKSLGSTFWSTRQPGKTCFKYRVGVNSVIRGWDTGIIGTKLGGIRRLRIPPNLAYGEIGYPTWSIPPKASLEYTIEILSINGKRSISNTKTFDWSGIDSLVGQFDRINTIPKTDIQIGSIVKILSSTPTSKNEDERTAEKLARVKSIDLDALMVCVVYINNNGETCSDEDEEEWLFEDCLQVVLDEKQETSKKKLDSSNSTIKTNDTMKHETSKNKLDTLSKSRIKPNNKTKQKQKQICNLCGEEAKTKPLRKCSGCGLVYYCSVQHQKKDWKFHKPMCLIEQKRNGKKIKRKHNQNLNKNMSCSDTQRLYESQMTGTFRWPAGTKFTPLPITFDPALALKCIKQKGAGWGQFCNVRFMQSQKTDGKLILEPSLIDGISFPITFLYAITLDEVKNESPIVSGALINIAVVGASAKTEERILRETNYWEEIGRILPCQFRIVFVGLEILCEGVFDHSKRHFSSNRKSKDSCHDTNNISFSTFKGSLINFLSKEKECGNFDDPDSSHIVIGFNTGLGSGNSDLMASWLDDLNMLMDKDILSIFTCANQHADLFGEINVMNIIDANIIAKPRRNAFSACSAYHAPGQREKASCANSFVYAIKGRKGAGIISEMEMKRQRYSVALLAKEVKKKWS